jgi:hypothetical protein
MNSYRTLIDLKLEHAFYSDGRMPGVRIVALPETVQRMRNHRLLLKAYGEGVRILQECRDVNGKQEPLVKPDAPLELLLGFQCNDALLQVRTASDFFSSNKKKFVFDMRGVTGTQTPEVLPVCRGTFAFQTSGAAGTFYIRNGKGDAVAALTAKAGDEELVFALNDETENRYTFDSGSESSTPFMLLHGDGNYDGIVILNSSDETQNLTAFFPARSIFWEYTVVPKYNAITQPELLEESERIRFERTAHPAIPDAWLFTSGEPVLLQERYNFTLQIEDQGRIMRKQIPFGDMNSTGTCLINVHNFCLKNYVMV